MAIFDIKNLSFSYPQCQNKALSNISFNVNDGEILLLIGESGCGKTTLLKTLKNELTPHGEIFGDIFYKGIKIDELSSLESAGEIGFIMQNPDMQIVTDKVYSEIAFGLENLDYNKKEIRQRVCEFASYFGLSDIFYNDTDTLSGGQKQLLNLASVMVMNPSVLILDEPTAQLDPISALNFIYTLKRINDDFGTTIIIAEHHLQDLFSLADRVLVMDNGQIALCGKPSYICKDVSGMKIEKAMPAPVQVFNALSLEGECPITVGQGRKFLNKNYNGITTEIKSDVTLSGEPSLECSDVWFRYSKKGEDILKGCDLSVKRGELYALLGSNGCGKTTLMNVLCGRHKPYRGKIKTFNNKLAYLVQNPRDLFVKETVEDDFKLINNSYMELSHKFEVENLLKQHPYDLSGGQLQKVGIIKILLTNPDVLLLDEPTKGLDAFAKEELGNFLLKLTASNLSVLLVTHDIEFAALFATRCGLLFDGKIATENFTNPFFSTNSFYTTASSRMSKNILKNAVTTEDVVKLCKERKYE